MAKKENIVRPEYTTEDFIKCGKILKMCGLKVPAAIDMNIKMKAILSLMERGDDNESIINACGLKVKKGSFASTFKSATGMSTKEYQATKRDIMLREKFGNAVTGLSEDQIDKLVKAASDV